MDGHGFDDLSRRFAAGFSRRVVLKGAAVGLLEALGLRGLPEAEARTQVTCGNKTCASDPGVCDDACVCCVYSNGNSRCLPPGRCGPGLTVCPPGERFCRNVNRCAVCCGNADCAGVDACTQGASCQAGVCRGGQPVVCVPSGPCVNASCDPAQGCVETPKAAGTPCVDTDRCDGDEACDGAGACGTGTPVVCAPPSPCQDPAVPGACDPVTGICNYTNKADGIACDTGNPCTADTCHSGVCTVGEVLDGEQGGCSGGLLCSAGVCTICGGPGLPCCSGDSCIGFNVCQAGVCAACGGPGQPCCPIFPCVFGANCAEDGICRPCGNIGSPCCSLGPPCQTLGICQENVCEVCGLPGDPCCIGNRCTFGTCSAGVCQP